MNNMDMQKLMSMLSKMDKNDLERGLAQASEILKAKENHQNSNNCKTQNMNNCKGKRM